MEQTKRHWGTIVAQNKKHTLFKLASGRVVSRRHIIRNLKRSRKYWDPHSSPVTLYVKHPKALATHGTDATLAHIPVRNLNVFSNVGYYFTAHKKPSFIVLASILLIGGVGIGLGVGLTKCSTFFIPEDSIVNEQNGDNVKDKWLAMPIKGFNFDNPLDGKSNVQIDFLSFSNGSCFYYTTSKDDELNKSAVFRVRNNLMDTSIAQVAFKGNATPIFTWYDNGAITDSVWQTTKDGKFKCLLLDSAVLGTGDAVVSQTHFDNLENYHNFWNFITRCEIWNELPV